VVFTDEALKELASRAHKENTGARGLVSVVEEALLPFEEKLPSESVGQFAITKQVLITPQLILNDLIQGNDKERYEAEYNHALGLFSDYINEYITKNWKIFSIRHGLTLTQIRTKMLAQYYTAHVMEIEDAVKQVKKFYDTVKEMELEISRNYALNVVFEEDAADFLIQQFIEHNASMDEILSKIYTDFFDGLNLIREKTGKSRFFLCKDALTDHEKYLNELIRKEIK
jgi:hypothetical protein